MKSLILLLSIFFSASLFASSASHICTSNPVALPKEIQLKTPKVDFVGLTPDGDPVYAHPTTEMILIFKKNFKDNNNQPNLSPKMIYAPFYRNYGYTRTMSGSFANQPITTLKAVIDSLGISCGGSRANQRPIEGDLSANEPNCFDKNIDIANLYSGYKRKKFQCCRGLEFNPNNLKCDEPQLFDIDLVKCEAHSECSSIKITVPSHEAGDSNKELQTGCYSQKVEDMFNRTPLKPLQDIVLDQSEDFKANHGSLKNTNESCNHSKQCKSYACREGKCAAPTICRLAKENEYVSGEIDCEYGYDPVGNKCEKGAASSPFIGPLQEITFEGEEGSQFAFDIPEEQKRIAIEAMKQIRAFEWLSLRLSKEKGDCFKLGKYLRENFGEKMYEKRKQILFDYSRSMNQIEKDFATLLAAKGDSKDLVTIGDENLTENLTEEELAGRETSGYDTLNFMLRKAIAQLEYETRMLALMGDENDGIATKMLKLSENMQSWRDNENHWKLSHSQQEQAFNCDAKYEKKDNWFSDWETVREKKVKNRWEAYYLIKDIPQNQDYLKKNEDLRYALSLIHQLDVDSTMQSFTGTIALFDPLNYRATGDLAFNNFGRLIDLNKENPPWLLILGAVVFILGGVPGMVIGGVMMLVSLFTAEFRETRAPREFDGSNNGTLVKFREAVKKDIFEHYKSLKTAAGDTYFIYEPELANFESKNAKASGKDCLEDIEQDICKKSTTGYLKKVNGEEVEEDNSFYRFMEMLTDFSMAHFLHYSQTSTGDYKGYFSEPKSARNKYFTRIATDAETLVTYYKALVEKREEQIEALTKVINGVDENFGTEGGINLDGGDYSSASGGQYAGGGKRETKGMSKVTRSSVKSRLSAQAASLLFDGEATSTADSSGGSIFGSAKSSGLAAISNAATKRRAKMKEVNDRARKKGIDVDKREQTRKELIASRAGSFSSVKPGSSQSSGLGSAGLGSAKLDAEVKDVNGGMGDVKADFDNSGDMGKSSGMSGGFGGISSGAAVTDPTGLSSEDKDFMVQNVERNPSKYRPEDFDNLFEVVSKAYARSLDRILIRKKPGEN
jgi:hypothetical protein